MVVFPLLLLLFSSVGIADGKKFLAAKYVSQSIGCGVNVYWASDEPKSDGKESEENHHVIQRYGAPCYPNSIHRTFNLAKYPTDDKFHLVGCFLMKENQNVQCIQLNDDKEFVKIIDVKCSNPKLVNKPVMIYIGNFYYDNDIHVANKEDGCLIYKAEGNFQMKQGGRHNDATTYDALEGFFWSPVKGHIRLFAFGGTRITSDIDSDQYQFLTGDKKHVTWSEKYDFVFDPEIAPDRVYLPPQENVVGIKYEKRLTGCAVVFNLLNGKGKKEIPIVCQPDDAARSFSLVSVPAEKKAHLHACFYIYKNVVPVLTCLVYKDGKFQEGWLFFDVTG
uniref:Uncharacterized protein n=1 Tax=Panagrolaimus sp. JU765 TaxID=591449 RepID=A0AC34RK22_9BILA